MKRKQVLEVLDKIDDEYIQEAEKAPKKKKIKTYWIGTIAAVLALVICVNTIFNPFAIKADAIALPGDARITECPDPDDYDYYWDYEAELEIWEEKYKDTIALSDNAASSLSSFFTSGSAEFLISEDNENTLWSPVNAYMGLAMLAETLDGDSRKEILDLLNVDDIETLRKQSSAVWEYMYSDEKKEKCILANSLWLDEGLTYNQEVMDNLAYHYYSSVYQCDLGSKSANKDIGKWLNKNTGGLLKDVTDKINLSPNTILALYSTLYFEAEWSSPFDKDYNTDDVFHGVKGDTTVTYMNDTAKMNYYWDDEYTAIKLPFKNDSTMWFILPDEGKTTSDILNDGSYGEMILTGDTEDGWQNKKQVEVNYSVPKFEITSTFDLKDGLKKMGVTKIFTGNSSDFTSINIDAPLYIDVEQSAKVVIDEDKAKAASFFKGEKLEGSAPPEDIEEIDFVLDRPFVFVIAKNNMPLFTGVMNNL